MWSAHRALLSPLARGCFTSHVLGLWVMATLGSAVLAGPNAVFWSPSSKGGMIRFSIQPHVILHPIASSELLRGSESQPMRYRGGPIEAPQINTIVTRHVPSLWRVTMPRGTNVDDLEITYDVLSEKGRDGCLSLRGKGDFECPVRILPTRPVTVERQDQVDLLEGGAILELDLTTVRYAGTYSGTLLISIHQL